MAFLTVLIIWVIYSGWQSLSVFPFPLQNGSNVIVAVVILPLIFLAIISLKVMTGSGKCHFFKAQYQNICEEPFIFHTEYFIYIYIKEYIYIYI